MEAIILAGGLGTRLRSEVKDVPKCMAPVAGKPFLWYLLKSLARFKEIDRIILSVGYLREVIYEWVPTIANEFTFCIDYAVEEEPLGTGGGIKLAMSKCTGRDVFIINGDTFFDVNLSSLIEMHRLHDDAMLTIALKYMTDFERYGTVTCNDDGRVISFNEKQYKKEGVINGGVYLLRNDVTLFDGQPQRFSFETDFMERASGNGGNIYGIRNDGYFIDIGIPEDYHKADNEFKNLFAV